MVFISLCLMCFKTRFVDLNIWFLLLQKALVFEVGGNAVIPGINEMVKEMEVGEKVQAIIPPQLAFGDKGICVDNGECLVKPKSYLVYDIYLKRSAIPPP
jgi:hypothetical protein